MDVCRVAIYHVEKDKEPGIGISSQEEGQPNTAGEKGGGGGGVVV